MSRSAINEALKILWRQTKYSMHEDLDKSKTPIFRKMIESIDLNCGCDDYVGYNCGCGFRRTVVKEALKELDKIEKEEKEMHIGTTIQLIGERFMLTIFVKPDLSFDRGEGFLSLMDKEKTFIANNISYFFNIDLEKKEELKGILKNSGFDTKGRVKELKALLKRANKLGIIKIK